MFNKDQKEVNIKDAETIIGPSLKIKGDFHGQGNIVIDGSVEGSVKTSNYLYVGEKAKINAKIEAKEAKISGEIHGNIKVHGYLEITATAKIFGDVETAEISIEKGAMLSGNCTIGKNPASLPGQVNKE
jgi:cytoskeletal protein CcmA (bactofilin family)